MYKLFNKNFFNLFFTFLAISAASFVFIIIADYYGRIFGGDLAAGVFSIFLNFNYDF